MTESTEGGHRPRRPFRWLVAWGVSCLVVAVGAFGAGTRLSSPWDDAVANATTRPAVTAAVEQRELSGETLTATGTASTGTALDVVPAASDAQIVVTDTPKAAGEQVLPGDLLVEVSGRPMIALALPFGLYRDLAPGDTGRDVKAVQQALRDLGLYSGKTDGAYGPSTAAAVRSLYGRVGAPAPVAAAEAQAALDEARSAREAAGREGADATTTAELDRAVEGARATADTPLPAAEIVALPADGAVIESVLPVGSRVDGEASSVAALRSGAPTATVRVGVGDVDAFGMGAAIDVMAVADTSTTATGEVVAVSEFRPADENTDLPGYDVQIRLGDQVFADGATVTATPQGGGDPVAGLAVPTVAVREEAGQAYVLLVDGAQRRVDVTVELSVDGYSLIAGDGIEAGTVVLIGVP